jgi:uncharacterized phiE125 gp8 family phage protein
MLKLITPATTSILGITATKNYLKVEHTTDDSLLTDIIIPSAISAVEAFSGYRTAPQIWEQYEEGGVDKISLNEAPVSSVDSVTVYENFDSTGYLITVSTDFRIVDNDLYHADGYWDKMRSGDGYTIRYTVGSWDDSDYRIAALSAAALRTAAWLYENREEFLVSVQESHMLNFDFSRIPAGAKVLLASFARNLGF